MKVGDRDPLGRLLRVIRDRLVLVRSRQAHSVAVCDTEGCGWTLDGKNAMGVASQHAATRGHRVVVTREVITEYDAETPRRWPKNEHVTGT